MTTAASGLILSEYHEDIIRAYEKLTGYPKPAAKVDTWSVVAASRASVEFMMSVDVDTHNGVAYADLKVQVYRFHAQVVNLTEGGVTFIDISYDKRPKREIAVELAAKLIANFEEKAAEA
jgi:hypothetical protein